MSERDTNTQPTQPSTPPSPLGASWIEWVGRASATTILAAIVISGAMGQWVFKSQYDSAVADRDTWKGLAIQGVKTAQQASDHTPLVGAVNVPLSSLPAHPSAAEVKERLSTIDAKTKFITEPEPTDVRQ